MLFFPNFPIFTGRTLTGNLGDALQPDYVVIGGKCDVRSKGVRAVCAGAKECGARVLGETELLPLLRSMQDQRAGPAVIRAEEQKQHKSKFFPYWWRTG